jgi:hypothetical protein
MVTQVLNKLRGRAVREARLDHPFTLRGLGLVKALFVVCFVTMCHTISLGLSFLIIEVEEEEGFLLGILQDSH